jgi:hypothetical protein
MSMRNTYTADGTLKERSVDADAALSPTPTTLFTT